MFGFVDVSIAAVKLNLAEDRIGEFGAKVKRLLFSVSDAMANVLNNDVYVMPLSSIKVFKLKKIRIFLNLKFKILFKGVFVQIFHNLHSKQRVEE